MKAGQSCCIILFIAAVLACNGCGSLPKLRIPFTGDHEKSTPKTDPQVAFNVRQVLGSGHTLKLMVFRGLSSPSKIYDGSVVVNERGVVHFKETGDIKIGGLTPLQAVKSIEAAFHNLHSASIVNVQLLQIEDTPLVTVVGAVRSPGVIQWFDGLNASSALPYVGGRTSRPEVRAVYVTRKGARKFHPGSEGVSRWNRVTS